MTGDLDLAANKLKFTNFVLKTTDIYTLGLWNRAETSYASFLVNGLYMYTFRGMATNTPFQSKYGTAHSSIDLKSWVDDAYVESMKIVDGETQISRAGDIIPAANNAQNLGTASKLWKNGYFINLISTTNLVDSLYIADLLQLPLSVPGTNQNGYTYYDVASDEIRVYGAGAWHVH